MALFNRQKKNSEEEEKDVFLGAKLTEVRYDSLGNLIASEVSVNSADSKIVSISFGEERVIKLWVSSDKIIAATDSGRVVDFKEFLFWINASDGLKSILINEVGELSPESLPAISTLAPALYESFVGYSDDYTLETLKWATKNFSSYTSVDTEIFKLQRVTAALENKGTPVTLVAQAIRTRIREEDNVRHIIGISGIGDDEVLLSLIDSTNAPDTPEEMFLTAASDAESNLLEALSLSTGFSTLKLLETLKRLVNAKVISLSFATEAEAQLPENLEAPSRPYERVFSPTSFGEPIAELAEQVFRSSAWLEEMLSLTADNEELEARIHAIELNVIEDLSDESFVDFLELPGDVQAIVRLLLNERIAHNDKRRAILTKIRENIIVQDFGLDKQLASYIDQKISGIEDATIHLDLGDLTTVHNDFQIEEHEIEFSFKDAVIEKDANGESFVRQLAAGEEANNLENLGTEKFLSKVAKISGDAPAVDLDSHAFEFEEVHDNLNSAEKASLGIRSVPARTGVLPPIFLQVASELGVNPLSIGK